MISSGEIDGSSGFVARSCPKQNKFEVMFLLRTGIVEHQHASSMFKGLPGYPFTSRFRRHTTRENSEFLTSRIM